MTKQIKTFSGKRLSRLELGAWRGFLRVHAALLYELNAELSKNSDLSISEYEVLLYLEDAPDFKLRMADLSELILLTPSGITRLVNRLIKEGYVDREVCLDDRRGYFTVLTESGLEHLRRARRIHLTGVREHFLSKFSEEEMKQLAEFWDRILPGSSSGPRNPVTKIQ